MASQRPAVVIDIVTYLEPYTHVSPAVLGVLFLVEQTFTMMVVEKKLSLFDIVIEKVR